MITDEIIKGIIMHHEPQYDMSITQFSPDGRILQVEYAREAVKRGALAAAIKYKNGVLVMADRQYHSSLIERTSKEKIVKINPTCCCVSSGLVADSRILVDYARRISAYNRVYYSEPIDLNTLVTRISNIKRSMTQYGGARPFGVSMLFCGTDGENSRIFETDPSGAFKEFHATAIGTNSARTKELLFELENDFGKRYSLKDSFEFMLNIFKKVKEDFQPDHLEICTIEGDEMKKFDRDDFMEFLGKKNN